MTKNYYHQYAVQDCKSSHYTQKYAAKLVCMCVSEKYLQALQPGVWLLDMM